MAGVTRLDFVQNQNYITKVGSYLFKHNKIHNI